MNRLVLAALIALPLAARAQAPKTDDDKTLYAIGMAWIVLIGLWTRARVRSSNKKQDVG